MKLDEFLSGPKLIPQNTLLHGTEKALELDKFLMLKKVADLGKEAQMGGELNLSYVSENFIREVHSAYGPEGLFQLITLAMAHQRNEFSHFIDPLKGSLALGGSATGGDATTLEFDNAVLRQSKKLDAFNSNVLQPSLARKLYRAGRHHGSLVYGLGGPRILVSHPFQGRNEDLYDLYANSVDVVTSLLVRGYHGTFHFLDFLPGLNHEVKGVPAWALWFSIIAIHSDLVVYVKEYEGDFWPAQLLEIEMTPDRVHKKIVEIPHDELKWAKKADMPEDADGMYVGENGMMTEEEWLSMEAEHAAPFIENYATDEIPRDRLFRIDEEGDFTDYPLDYTVYGAGG